jgi:hypothetical protein
MQRTIRTTEDSKYSNRKETKNGVIVCKTEKDQQASLYVGGVRKLRYT